MWSKNSEPNFCPHDVDVDDDVVDDDGGGGNSDDDDDDNDDSNDWIVIGLWFAYQIANSVFCASMSYAVFNLLTRDEDGTSTKTVNPSRGSGSSAWLGGNCSLNQGHERQGQVAALNATLWTHLSLIGDSRWNHR